jgi:hypothetical protein
MYISMRTETVSGAAAKAPSLAEEVGLLIKSRYPVVFLETVDETAALGQLRGIAGQLGMDFFEWSLTEGLRRGGQKTSYYQTKDPQQMLQTVLTLQRAGDVAAGLYVLKDVEKCLGDAVTLRLFKDAVNQVRNTRSTFVIVAPSYGLPPDVECDSAHILAGYPCPEEIEAVVRQVADDVRASGRGTQVSLSDAEIKDLTAALKGLTTQQIRNVLNQCALSDARLDGEDIPAVEEYKKKIFDQEGLLEFYPPERQDAIAGFENLKRWLADRREAFSAKRAPSIPSPKGVLLMGVQGCGKSFAVKVIAGELGLPLCRLDVGRLYSKYIGETEQNLRKALAIVDKLCPVCLWIDEIEKGFAASAGDVDGGVSRRMLGAFLTWMQERKSACFVAATANDVYSLPPEFLRKGRFDEIFFVDLPDAGFRDRILRIHLARRGLAPAEFDIKALADACDGFSGAEIEQAVISALYRASSSKQPIATGHILDQIHATRPLSVLKHEEIADLRDWARERTVPA